jgi:hypothetical protein
MWLPPLAIAAIIASLAAPFVAFRGRTHFAFALIASLVIAMTILCGITYGTRDKDYFT